MTRRLASRSIPGAVLLALAVPLITPASAGAQQANVTLSRDVALWSDVVEARIEGVGCLLADTPAVNPGNTEGVIEIQLLGCADGSTTPFTTVARFGPLYPDEYTVRILDARSRSTLDTATLTVHAVASLEVDVPEVATDAAPVTLVFSGPTSSPCFILDGPVVTGRVIEALFADACPVLPLPGVGIFARDFDLGPLPAGEYEVRFFDLSDQRFGLPALHRETFVVHDADGCVPSDSVLCLQDGRFKVEVEWKDFFAREGVGHPIPLDGGDGGSGLFWFFAPDNVELTVKVLDGCASNDHWWVFLSSGSTVAYTVTVTDTATGGKKEYSNTSGTQAPLIADTSAFRCSAP